ncbi:MAG: 23S rRNA (adenine(2503)-C(2))-methyltransferase RlmN [Eubacteriales bacterium]|nr:23S rRNA (adenine(2503)-C(2))-methyltransferase RlmN [Eubacteriales bacterium]
MKRFLYDLDRRDWSRYIQEKGLPPYRAGQIASWSDRGVASLDEMTDLPLALREQLAEDFTLDGLELAEKLTSGLDDTAKYIFRLADGNIIESVLMHYKYGWSVCISSQAGCRMGCSFCASTGAGFGRSLSDGEMLAQVHAIARDGSIRVGHVTIMGIGEPLDNFEAVVRFLRRANDPRGLNISMRHLSVSTCGLVPKMIEFTDEGLPVTLSVSLHAPNDTIRRQLMPIARQYPYDSLLAACRRHTEKTGRRVTFEYALFKGVNDQPEHADELAERLRGMLCHVNLIPANEFSGGIYRQSRSPDVQRFLSRLTRAGIKATVRRELGADIMAACGQLRRRKEACRTP